VPKHGWFREHLTLQLRFVVLVLTESMILLLILLSVRVVADVKERLFDISQPQENRQNCMEKTPPSNRRRVHRRR
jgi:hypothetical protein